MANMAELIKWELFFGVFAQPEPPLLAQAPEPHLKSRGSLDFN